MKCPRCNYVSFDTMPRCKKCGFQFKASRVQQETVDVRSLIAEGNVKAGEAAPGSESLNLKKTVSSIRETLDEIEGRQRDGNGDPVEDRSPAVDTDELKFRVDSGYIDSASQFPDHSAINWEESISLSNHDFTLPLHDDATGDGEEEPAEQSMKNAYTTTDQFRRELREIGEELKEIDEMPGHPPHTADASRHDAGDALRAAPKGGFWIRGVAYLLDTVILYLLAIVLAMVGIIALGIASPDLGDLDEERIMGLMLPLYLFNTVMNIFYYTYFHGSVGQTPGKMLCRLKVVRVNGEALGYARAFLRWVGYIPSSLLFCLGFLWAAWDRQKQSWHDKIAGTYVIKL